MDITINTPAILFPAISLIILAYTNRFLALSNRVRSLHEKYNEVEDKKIIQQCVRFVLTLVLLFYIYKGKNTARVVGLILFSFGVLGAIFGISTLDQQLILKVPLIVMIVVYSAALYHFGFSRSYKAFAAYQKGKLVNDH